MSKHQPLSRSYWYTDVDINRILKQKSSDGLVYYVTDSASQNDEQALQRIDEAFAALERSPKLLAAVVPINLGYSKQGVYHGSHWTGLVVKRTVLNESSEAAAAASVISPVTTYQAFYNDSLGSPMDNSLPQLKQILINHGISEKRITDFHTKQQDNGYDCGPWTILNLDSLARTGRLPKVTKDEAEAIIVRERMQVLEIGNEGEGENAEVADLELTALTEDKTNQFIASSAKENIKAKVKTSANDQDLAELFPGSISDLLPSLKPKTLAEIKETIAEARKVVKKALEDVLESVPDVAELVPTKLASIPIPTVKLPADKIRELKQIEQTHYKPLIGELVYKQDLEELKTLVEVLKDLGDLTKQIGDYSINSYEGLVPRSCLDITALDSTSKSIIYDYLSEVSPLKYYTDAATFYQYVATIINEKINPKHEDSIYIEELESIYEKLDELRSAIILISTITSERSQNTKRQEPQSDPTGIDMLSTDASVGITLSATSQVSGSTLSILSILKTHSFTKDEADINKAFLISLRSYAKERIDEIESYRIHARDAEKEGNKTKAHEQQTLYVNSSRSLFEEIATQMKGFLAKLYIEGETELARAGVAKPCNYSVMGLGSMALNQMTPWSDLEFAILTEDEDYKNNPDPKISQYFKNLTHLVHFMIINLGETVIPTSRYEVDTSHLVHVGVNFDLGGKTPLGRIDSDKPYELIKTVEWMMHYVRNEEIDGKKTEHIDKALPYVLENVCYIYGNEELLTQYKIKVQAFLQGDYRVAETKEAKYQDLKNYQARALKILEEGATEINYMGNTQETRLRSIHFEGDIPKLSPVFGDKEEGKLFDVKHEIYRLPDRMVYNLGMYFGVFGNSAWDTIEVLHAKGVIKPKAAINLKNAVAFATLLRLQTYSHNGGQRDNMSTYQLALEHLSEQEKEKFTQQTFYIEDTKVLHEFYYVMLRVMEIATGLCITDQQKRQNTEEVLKQDNLYADTNYNKGRVHARFLEYDKAIEYLEEAKEEKADDLYILNDLFFLYNKTAITEQAVKTIESIVLIIKKKYEDNANHPSVAGSYNNLGEAHRTKGNYEEAIKAYKTALNIQFKIHLSYPNYSNIVNIAGSYNNLGEVYTARGEHELAVKYHSEALKLRLKAYDNNPNHPDIAGSYNNLGEVFRARGDYEEAIKAYKTALRIQLKVHEKHPNHPDIAINYNNLGAAYCAKGAYADAAMAYNNALKIQLKSYVHSPNHTHIATSYHNLGNICRINCEYDKAIHYNNLALNIRDAAYINNPNHPSIASSYNNLGEVYRAKGDHEEALKYHNRALKIRLKAYDDNPNHPDIADSYNNLGTTYYDKGDFDDAIKYNNLALNIRNTAYINNPNHPSIASSYNNLGEVYRAKGDHEEALKYHNRALKIRLKAYDNNPNHPDIADSYNNLGTTYYDKGDFDDAIKNYNIALKIQRSAYLDNLDHLDIATSYNNLGVAYYIKKEYEEAIKCHNQSLKIRLKVYKDKTDHPDIASNYNNLGAVYHDKGEYDNAIKYNNLALSIKIKAYQHISRHYSVASSYSNLGGNYYAKKNYEQATKYHEKALEIVLEAYKDNPNHLAVARIYNNLSITYVAIGEKDSAIKYQQMALEAFLVAHKHNLYHPDIALSYSNLSNNYHHAEKYQEALFYGLKAIQIFSQSQNQQGIANSSMLCHSALTQLGNEMLLTDCAERAMEYYSQIDPKYKQINITSPEFIKLQFEQRNMAYESGELAAAINCQLVLLKIDPKLSYDNHYHNLACFYSAKGNIVLANETFLEALKCPEIKMSLHVEYAQFLLLNQNELGGDKANISKHLYAAISGDNDNSALNYGDIEKNSICKALRAIIEQKNSTITISPKILSYYLLIKYSVLLSEASNVPSILALLKQSCDALQDSIAFTLLADVAKFVGHKELATEALLQATVLERIEDVFAGKLKINPTTSAMNTDIAINPNAPIASNNSLSVNMVAQENSEYMSVMLTAPKINKAAELAIIERRYQDAEKLYAKLFGIYDQILQEDPKQVKLVVDKLATVTLLKNNVHQFIGLKLQYDANLNMELIQLSGQDPELILSVGKRASIKVIEIKMMTQTQEQASDVSLVSLKQSEDVDAEESRQQEKIQDCEASAKAATIEDKENQDINRQDESGYSLLMYAAADKGSELPIDEMLKLNADPFITDHGGNSALSLAISKGNAALAQKFFQTKREVFHNLPEIQAQQYLEIDLTHDQYKKDFYNFIASNICLRDSKFREALGLSHEAAQICFSEIIMQCEELGMDTTRIFDNYHYVD